MDVIAELAEVYPQLYLDPERNDTEAYRAIVLRGDRPESKDLSHFVMDPRDRTEYIKTPAGTAQVTTLYTRRDFEVFVRCMMAAKDGPDKEIPATMGASTLITFNWQKIRAREENYKDMIILLSRGPYSNVPASDAGLVLGKDIGEEEWLDISDDIRKYHELTHFVCRTLYPDMIDAVWDELVADAAGIYAALGRYDRGLEELFLGIKDGRYAGGRLENYLNEDEDIESLVTGICTVLSEFEKIAEEDSGRDVFELILVLEDKKDCFNIRETAEKNSL